MNTNTKVFRYSTVLIAVLIAIVAAVFGVLELPVPAESTEIIYLVVGVLVAAGIAVQTGKAAKKFTWAVFLEKLSSAPFWIALAALFAFLVTLDIGTVLNEVLRITLIIAELIAMVVGIINDANNKKALVNDVGKLETQNIDEPAITPQ